ncbi:matrixin family metalloprotease [Patescibacteria group bacterium]|nr:matrixin family metalloprotease [Patescibacteria group bacterium]
MKLVRIIILYGMLGLSLMLFWNAFLRNPCRDVVQYDIGIFDERFNMSREDFIHQIQLAESSWEDAAEQEFFEYVPGSDFKVNLIWSDEQERLYKGNDLEQTLGTQQGSIESLQNRYQSAVNRYERSKKEYEQKLAQYEDDVTYWNSQGGAPEEEYQALQDDAVSLENKAGEVKTLLAQVNRIAEENNQKVERYNDNVAVYNNLFATGHEFDAGNTDRTEINVYSYDGIDELHTLLVHEFGHVLGLDHVNDPASVMYYLLNEQNQKGVLTDTDIAALQSVCNLSS